MNTNKTIGYLLIAGAFGVMVPYTILTFTFNYPDILREETGTILTSFQAGGPTLVFTWLAFALLGLPLLPAYILIGQKTEAKTPHFKWVTTIGVVSILAQFIGLLRWVFVVPALSNRFVGATIGGEQESIKISFELLHQFGGVLIGEHIGQFFTIVWTVFISVALVKQKLISKWLALWGIIASAIYFLAQAELLVTVIHGFPIIAIAGLLGSTLWLLWLLFVGVRFFLIGRKSTVLKRSVKSQISTLVLEG